MLWSTSMEIPVGAPDPRAALEWMNYVYDPKVQADIAEYVNYVTPVSGVKEILAKRDPELARNQLIFPSRSYTRNCTFEPVLGRQAGRAGHEGLRAGAQRLIVRTLSIAGLQIAPVAGDPEATLERFADQAAAAKRAVGHLQLLVLPELHLSAPAPDLRGCGRPR